MRADPIPLYHRPLLRGFYRKAEICLVYEHKQSTEPQLFRGPTPSHCRAPITSWRSGRSLSVKVTILMENVHVTTPCYFSFFIRTSFSLFIRYLKHPYERELYFCHKTVCPHTRWHTIPRSHAALVSVVSGD